MDIGRKLSKQRRQTSWNNIFVFQEGENHVFILVKIRTFIGLKSQNREMSQTRSQGTLAMLTGSERLEKYWHFRQNNLYGFRKIFSKHICCLFIQVRLPARGSDKYYVFGISAPQPWVSLRAWPLFLTLSTPMCVCKSLTIQINRFNSLTTPIAIDVIVVFEDLTLAAGHLVQVRTFYLTQTQISCLHVKANFPGRILFLARTFLPASMWKGT